MKVKKCLRERGRKEKGSKRVVEGEKSEEEEGEQVN